MTDAKSKSKTLAIRAARIARYRARRRPVPKGLLSQLGPGLITGASDDDSSRIATYPQAGAQFGYAMCWVMLFCFPLMAENRCHDLTPLTLLVVRGLRRR